MVEFKHLEWDSLFFGFPVASFVYTSSINIDQVLNTLSEKNYQLVYFFMPQHFKVLSSTILKKFGGILADQKITYRYVFSKTLKSTPCQSIKVNSFTQVDNDLIKLAITAGNFSRFKTDPKFGENNFRNLYKEWIKKSVSGEIADYVITYQINRKAKGLVTLKIINEMAKIGLISVSEKMRSTGIGTCLLNEVFAICQQQGVKNIEVVTQKDNVQACRFYKKNGFVEYKSEYVYHFWLKNNDSI